MGEVHGPNGWRQNVAEPMLSAFSDLTHSIENVIAGGDTVVTRVKEGGIHTGEFMGIPSPNEEFKVDGVHIVCFEDGNIAEVWSAPDTYDFMDQMGVTCPKILVTIPKVLMRKLLPG